MSLETAAGRVADRLDSVLVKRYTGASRSCPNVLLELLEWLNTARDGRINLPGSLNLWTDGALRDLRGDRLRSVR